MMYLRCLSIMVNASFDLHSPTLDQSDGELSVHFWPVSSKQPSLFLQVIFSKSIGETRELAVVSPNFTEPGTQQAVV